MSRLEVFILVVALLLLVVVVEVVRRRRLSEGWALLWIAVGVGGVVLGLARPLIDRFAGSLGIVYGVNLVFTLVFLFLLVVSINLSMHISRLEDKVEKLAEEVALLRGPVPPEEGPAAEGTDPATPTAPGDARPGPPG